MKKYLSIIIAIIMAIIGVATMATANAAGEVAAINVHTPEVRIDHHFARDIKRAKHIHAKRARRRIRRIRRLKKAIRNILRTIHAEASALAKKACVVRPKRRTLTRLLVLPALLICGIPSMSWEDKRIKAEENLHNASSRLGDLTTRLQNAQQPMRDAQLAISAIRAEIANLQDIKMDYILQVKDADLDTKIQVSKSAYRKYANLVATIATRTMPTMPELKDVEVYKTKLEHLKGQAWAKYGANAPTYVLERVHHAEQAYFRAVHSNAQKLATYMENKDVYADLLSATVEAKAELNAADAAVSQAEATTAMLAKDINKVAKAIDEAKAQKLALKAELEEAKKEYQTFYASLPMAEAQRALQYEQRKLDSLTARIATESAREAEEEAEAQSIGAFSTDHAGKHSMGTEARMAKCQLRIWTDALEMKTIVGISKDAVMAKYKETIKSLRPYQLMKLELDNGETIVHKIMENRNGQISELHNTTIPNTGKVVTADMQFASAITKHTKKGLLTGHGVSDGDYHGKGSYAPWQLVILDQNHKVVASVCFATEVEARSAFEEANDRVTNSMWTAQLFHNLILTRYTGDTEDIANIESAITERIVINKMVECGLRETDARKVAEYFCVATREGEAQMKAAVESDTTDAIRAVPGIGPKKAIIIKTALEDVLRDFNHVTDPVAKYTKCEKLVLGQDGSISSTFVNVKASRLIQYLEKIAGDTTDAPAMLYFEHNIAEKDDDSHMCAVITLRNLVAQGLDRHGITYVPTLHGTNAGKTNTTIWVREDLKEVVRGFCTADSNKNAKLTAAKFNAYMGLMAVGTDNMPFSMDAKWLGIIPELMVEIQDRVIKVDGQSVSDVNDGVVKQPAFDGVCFCHFSNKVKAEIIAKAENKVEVRKYLDHMESGSVRLLPWNKAMMITGVDFHNEFKKRGIKQINCVGRGMVNVEDLCFLGTTSIFKGSIGTNGTHATWADYEAACKKYDYHPGYVLHAHDPKITTLPSQQLQCCAGISKDTVNELTDAAVAEINKLRDADNAMPLVGNKVIAELLTRVQQLAAVDPINNQMQEAYERQYNVGRAGKLFNSAIGAFVAPDPKAFITWAAYQDPAKVETSIKAWNVVMRGDEYDDKDAIISRNPCTDLSALAKVHVNSKFDDMSFCTHGVPKGVVFTSILDTIPTRLRMDFDGDHVNLCFVPAFIKAVHEASKLWYPNEKMYPVIDWEPMSAEKKVLHEEDLQDYYANLWHSSKLGHYMDMLTKLYSTIACGAIAIDEDVKKAVAWLTYAVNVLVDASKHGMGEIEEPDFVAKYNDTFLSLASTNSKLFDRKDVDLEKTYTEYGEGILDVLASNWEARVDSHYALNGCDYTKAFDPRVLESTKRVADFSKDLTGNMLSTTVEMEMNSIAIHNMCNKSNWKFYPFKKDADGNYTTEIVGATEFVVFDRKRRYENWDEVGAATFKLGDYMMVHEGEETKVYRCENYNELGDPIFEQIPGKWISHECTETMNTQKYTAIFAILEARKAEIEDLYRVSGDKTKEDIAMADRAAKRKYLVWSAQQSLQAYAALYGYTYEDCVDKIVTWLLRPRKWIETEKKFEEWNSKQLIRFMFDVCGDNLIANIDARMANAAA